MIGPISRILLRYLAGFLVLKAVLPEDVGNMISTDPDLVAVVGALIAGGVEGFYMLARKYGWSK